MGPKKDQHQAIAQLQQKIREYETKFQNLEARIETLEASEAVLKTVTANLRNELDSLDQYGRRSNILIRNVEINDGDNKETDQQNIESMVNDMISEI